MTNEVTRTAPKRIWLQISDESEHKREPFPYSETQDITWCEDSVIACQVEYIRADIAAERIRRAKRKP